MKILEYLTNAGSEKKTATRIRKYLKRADFEMARMPAFLPSLGLIWCYQRTANIECSLITLIKIKSTKEFDDSLHIVVLTNNLKIM